MRPCGAHVFACLTLSCVALVCSTMSPVRASEDIEPRDEYPSAFYSIRHPDTVDFSGPYAVTLRELAGEKVTSGDVVYAVWNAQGEKEGEGRRALRSTSDAKEWVASIPGQSTGSVVTYHFELATPTGRALRHPTHSTANYRFRVLGLKVLAVAVSSGSDQLSKGPSVNLKVRSVSRPEGDVILRHMSHGFAAPRDIRVALATEEPEGHERALSTYTLKARLPSLNPGELADFYFSLRSADESDQLVPTDAPMRVYSVKNPRRPVQTLNSDSFVLDISPKGRDRWIGMKGGGVRVWNGRRVLRHWDMKNGMPSGVARFVISDAVAGRVHVGTDRGVVSIDDEGNSLVGVVTPVLPAWKSRTDSAGALLRQYRAGPGALSSLDGALVFQVQSEQEFEQEAPSTFFVQLKDDKVTEWRTPVEAQLIALSSLSFDQVRGCWLIGGIKRNEHRSFEPVVVESCGEEVETIAIEQFNLGDHILVPERVVDVTRDPKTGALVIALEFTVSQATRLLKGFGVYRIKKETGELFPLAQGSATINAEVTSLEADWRRSRLLIGTFGQGILTVEGDSIGPLPSTDELPAEITAVTVDQKGDAILVGTSDGAYELRGDQVIRLSTSPSGEDLVLTDAIPMDVAPETGNVLLSSYSQGLIQIAKGEDEIWRPIEALRPGRELPEGLFGDAQYSPTSGKTAVVHSQGILRAEDTKAKILGRKDGLHSQHILRLLTLRSGETWVAFTPMPFGQGGGAALQLLRGDEILRTIDIQDRNLATISRWVEVPERASVFAATRIGVVEIDAEGTLTRLSKNGATSVSRNPTTGTMGAVGNTVEEWDGQRFVPVLFRVDHPRSMKGQYYAGTPIDVAVDRRDFWYVLFNKGVLVILDSQGEFLGLMDGEDGIPSSARRMLLDPASGDLIIGSSREGLVVVPTAK